MFLDVTMKRNPALIESAIWYHQQGLIEPDTYVVDLDAVLGNGAMMRQVAEECKIELYFMTKQFGRNPLVAQELQKLGYKGAVAVDYKEAKLLIDAGVHVGNLGHLVQTPSCLVEEFVRQQPDVITVYTVAKAQEISQAARKIGWTQPIMLRVIGEQDVIYPGQEGGFYLSQLWEVGEQIRALPNIKIVGVTSFPCFTYEQAQQNIIATANVQTVLAAKRLLEEQGHVINQVNLPSATCVHTIPKIAKYGGTHGEPGHGLLGSTPLHAVTVQPEIPAMVYVSEISHVLGANSYCYGGGYYRRSHISGGLVGQNLSNAMRVRAAKPDAESIDYYFTLQEKLAVGATAVFAFRSQVFVTRSDVAIIRGNSTGQPKLLGVYNSLGQLLKRGESQ